MSGIPFGGPGEISPVEANTTAAVFENAIRAFGAVNAGEWFGHLLDSEFTVETVRVLLERTAERPAR